MSIHSGLKIAFASSSVEAGKDGMGDYTLSLAAALVSLGHSVFVVGLYDCWIKGYSADTNRDPAGIVPHAHDLFCARLSFQGSDFRLQWSAATSGMSRQRLAGRLAR